MSEDQARAWVRILRDIALASCGAFILIYETVGVQSPNPYLLAAGLTALGLPPAFRLDGKKNGEK